MIPDLAAATRTMPGLTRRRIRAPLARPVVTAMLTDAGYAAHEDVVSVYTSLNGAAMERADLELWVWSLEELLAEDAWEHLLESSGFDPDDEAGEELRRYRVFAKHERSLWLVNLHTLETAVAFDEEVTPLSVDFAGMIAAIIAAEYAPSWPDPYRC